MSYPADFVAGNQVTAAEANDYILNPVYTYGETIAAGAALYLKAADGKAWKVSALTLAETKAFVGFAKDAGNANDTKHILGPGHIVTGLSGLTAGSPVYLTDTAGTVDDVPGTTLRQVGIALSTTSLLVHPDDAESSVAFGDGSDGAVNMDGTNTYAGFASKVGDVYTLTRDVYATSLAVQSGKTLEAAGFRIFATRRVYNAGTIRNKGGAGGNGGNATGSNPNENNGTAGTAAPGGSMPAGVAGGAGGDGNDAADGNGEAGVAGTASNRAVGATTAAAGGAGGNGGGGTGGAAGAAGTNSGTAANVPRNVTSATTLFDMNGTAISQLGTAPGSGGGGGGASNLTGGGGGGGGGGAPGGYLFIAAPVIVNSGTISANGGNGGTGGNGWPAGNTGGGGGGGAGSGGAVILIYRVKSDSGTIQAVKGTVGSGGTKTGTGTVGAAGAAGTDGKVIEITQV